MLNSIRNQLGLLSLLVVATGFVLLWAVVPQFYPLGGLRQALWYGALLSFCEAGIAGGLADWFAVTALFRHPLGIPIPHTNLLVEKRHYIQQNIGGMIRQLLEPGNVQETLEKINLVQFLEDILKRPDFHQMLHRQGPRVYGALLTFLRAERTREALTDYMGGLLNRLDYASMLTSILQEVPENSYGKILDGILDNTLVLFDKNSQTIANGLRVRIQQHRGFGLLDRLLAFFTGKDIEQNILPFVRAELVRVRTEPQHPIRQSIHTAIRDYLVSLKEDEEAKTAMNHKIREFIKDINFSQKLYHHLEEGVGSLQGGAGSEEERLSVILDGIISTLADALRDEPVRKRLNEGIKTIIAAQFNEKVILWISEVANTGLNKMSDAQFRDFIESRVKEDLQYIRLNGAVVGGLAGMMLYFIRVLTP